MSALRPLKSLAAALALTIAAPLAVQAAEGRLVLYTSQPNADAQATVDAFTAAHPDVEVEWVRDGTTQMMARLATEFEAGSPQPDVLLIADMVTMEGLKQEGRLMAHPDADTSAYDEGLMDPEGYYFSTKLITTGIVYNTAAPFQPDNWLDLLRDEAIGQVRIPSPLTSGAALIHLETLTSNLDMGWEYYELLAARDTIAAGGNGGTFNAVAGGEQLFGMVVDFLAIREKANGAPVEFVFPSEGVSAVTEPVAILSTAQNPEAAKAFVDFLLSPAGQQLAADQGYVPAHPDIELPAGFPPRDEITVMDFDPAQALASSEENRIRFADLFGQ
ncbi:MAG: ABC transporter substrate-binding protein [Rhizobiales bacterium]|nr:ABC transporter substrate-binding protein [Hyphomicrobiales bacterium]MBO6700092.1 ABC transporter substrate-binding protein [Hyphomicrobiales bacterium]MBO6737743.1 ABC transporter substrate-binding protein [Hyphomicrobiales bacterium]MBO6913200.1 ABC transporter substrate-binding protein [Hyphomicrobiales bacterium]MBO6954244.1 ABC transporter substrate-binding protein [Hyphomicrobiales bacterium]